MPRWAAFLVFFSIFMTVWGSANYYIFKRGWQALPDMFRLKRAYIALAIFLATAWVGSRFLENLGELWINKILIWCGSVWLGFASMLFLFCIVIDLIRLGNLVFHYFPSSWAENPQKIRWISVLTVFGIVALINIIGFINGMIVRTRTIDITVNKPYGPGQLKVAMMSDIHLGTIIGAGRLKRLVETVNTAEPDLILLPGDIVDEGVHPYKHPELCRLLKSLNAPLGVFGTTGNHEFIVGVEKSVPFLEACGIDMLRDEVIELEGGIYLAGRDDVAKAQMGDKEGRMDLDEIVDGIDQSRPLLLMDHTPYRLAAAQEAKVDLQVSGHTHNGQLWPFNYITAMIFEQDWGYLQKGNTHYYVSCGAGIWGPPVRTNSICEVVIINIVFRNAASESKED